MTEMKTFYFHYLVLTENRVIQGIRGKVCTLVNLNISQISQDNPPVTLIHLALDD